jgi:hypothetical protein
MKSQRLAVKKSKTLATSQETDLKILRFGVNRLNSTAWKHIFEQFSCVGFMKGQGRLPHLPFGR